MSVGWSELASSKLLLADWFVEAVNCCKLLVSIKRDVVRFLGSIIFLDSGKLFFIINICVIKNFEK